MDTNLAVRTNGKALATYGEREDVKELSARFRLLIMGGKRLDDAESMALAQYSIATQLDVFTGECWYIPGVGPVPGIAGWRKKADEQLEYEARKAGKPGTGRIWFDHNPGIAGLHARFDADKDICVMAVLHDSLTKEAHEQRVLKYFIQLTQSKIEGAWEIANKIVGEEPVWIGVGIVRGNENFGQDKMDRYARAEKRADKAALRKRFPRIHLPEPEGYDDAADIVDGIIQPEQPPAPDQPKRAADTILGELGY